MNVSTTGQPTGPLQRLIDDDDQLSAEVGVPEHKEKPLFTRGPWVTAGLISAATTLVIVGLLLVTQPRGWEPAPPDPAGAAVAATQAAVVPAAAPAAKPTATPKASASAPVQKKATPAAKKTAAKKTATKSPAKKTSSSGSAATAVGAKHTGVATFYAATGAGNCSFDAGGDLMIGAMNQTDYANSQACGSFVRVTGPNGTITIKIVDRCPECPPGAIDLSQKAFAKIAPVSAGKVAISWRLLSPAGLGSVSYRYKSGSSQYWCGIQVLHHRNPVRAVQVKVNGSWKTLARQTYNYFLSENGAGCGAAIRVTDVYGNQITDTGISIAPDKIQRGQHQFPAA